MSVLGSLDRGYAPDSNGFDCALFDFAFMHRDMGGRSTSTLRARSDRAFMRTV